MDTSPVTGSLKNKRLKLIPRRRILDETSLGSDTGKNKSVRKETDRTLRRSAIMSFRITSSSLLNAHTPINRKDSQTPYRTPRIKSAIVDYNANSKKQKSQWKDELCSLLGRTWKVCYLSSMTNFFYMKRNSKSVYQSQLSSRISEVFSSFRLTVEISTSSCISQNVKKTDAVIFKVTSFDIEQDETDTKSSVVYHAWLFRVSEIQNAESKNSAWFPLMLYHGTEKIHATVINWIQATFSCYVIPKGFPANSLQWIAAIWSREKCATLKHNVVNETNMLFHYLLVPPLPDIQFDPPNDKSRPVFKLTFRSSDIKNCWTKVEPVDDKTVDRESLMKFHKGMGKLVTQLTKIPASHFKLALLRTPCITIARDGRIKLTCAKKFAALLHHLMEIFLDICHKKNAQDSVIEELDFEERNEELN